MDIVYGCADASKVRQAAETVSCLYAKACTQPFPLLYLITLFYSYNYLIFSIKNYKF